MRWYQNVLQLVESSNEEAEVSDSAAGKCELGITSLDIASPLESEKRDALLFKEAAAVLT